MESIDKLSVNAKEKEFWEKMQAFPLGVRDHMPGFYLAPFRTKAPSKFTPPTQLDEEASAWVPLECMNGPKTMADEKLSLREVKTIFSKHDFSSSN